MNDRSLMKQHTHRKPMDEREKLRKFRELDDAFAEALRELEAPANLDESPLEVAARPDQASDTARQQDFEERLRALMHEYHQPAEQVAHLVQLLRQQGHIA